MRSHDPGCDILVIQHADVPALRVHSSWRRIDSIKVKGAVFFYNELRSRAKWLRAGLRWN